MEGHGIMQKATGDRYVGNFQDDLKTGTGIWYSVKDQTKRQGEWLNDKRVSWLSAPQEYHVSGYGQQTSTGNI